jgi:hypothetical protein
MGFRRRVRRRALLVGGVAGVAVARHRAAGSEEQEQEPAEDYQDQAPPAADPADEIEHLGQLHSSGVLTDEEFSAAKAKILGS